MTQKQNKNKLNLITKVDSTPLKTQINHLIQITEAQLNGK